MGLALPNVARSAHAGVTAGLGKGAFNPASRPIHVMEFGRLLTCACCLQHFVTLLRKADRHAPSGRLSCGAMNPERASLTSWLSEPDTDDRLAFGIFALMPGDAVLALWTRHHLVVPVDVELGDIEGAGGTRLPTWVHMHRPNEVNVVRVTALNDAFGADVAGIDQVLLRQQVIVRECRLD